MSSFSFSFGQPPAQQPAAGSAFGSGTGLFGQTTPASTSGGLFSGLGSTTTQTNAAPGFGTGGLFSSTTTQPSSLFGSTAAATAAPSLNLGSAGSAPTVFAFPTKSSEPSASSGPAGGAASAQNAAAAAKAGFLGARVKEQPIENDLQTAVADMENTVRKYQKMQQQSEDVSMQDALEWQSEMKSFDYTLSRVTAQLSATFALVDTLRKNAARLRAQNLLSSRLAMNPGAYSSLSPSIEGYFNETMSTLRSEMEIMAQELSHLESLHDEVLRPKDSAIIELQGTYAQLTRVVNEVASSVDDISKLGEELRREMLTIKGEAPPVAPAPPPTVLGQDVAQLNAVHSLFSRLTATPQTKSSQSQTASKSPLLQPLTADAQFISFNPAMRTLSRMDSFSQKGGSYSGSSPTPNRNKMDYSFATRSPGF